jgi:hypothetical protein
VKNHSLIIIGLVIACFLGVFAQIGIAQKSLPAQDAPQGKKSALQNYIDISALPMGERPAAFGDLSPEDMARVFRFHLAYQIMKRPELSSEQREMIVEGIAGVTPDSYRKNRDTELDGAKSLDLKARGGSIFPRRELFEIFASLGGDKNDIAILGKYQQITLPVYETQRKNLFIALSPQDKSDVIRIHMTGKLAEKGGLTIEQIRITAESIFLCVPEIYLKTGEDGKGGSSPSVKAIVERIAKGFEKQEAFEIFASLGGESGGPVTEEGSCLCSTIDDWCSWWGPHGSNCMQNSASHPCTPRSIGCGAFLGKGCNGTCVVTSIEKK